MQDQLAIFLNAVYAGDVDETTSLLRQDDTLATRASVGEPGQHERDVAAIHLAAFIGHLQLMEILFEAGADVNATGRAGTPLFQAVVAMKGLAVDWLLTRGANVKYVHPNGETALHIAAYAGDPSIVAALLNAGANPNAKTSKGHTDTIPTSPPVMGESPLHLAAAYGHLDVIDQLIDAHADRNAEDHIGATPIHWAGRYLQVEARKQLLRR